MSVESGDKGLRTTHLPNESETLESVGDLLKSSLARSVAGVVRGTKETARFIETLHQSASLNSLYRIVAALANETRPQRKKEETHDLLLSSISTELTSRLNSGFDFFSLFRRNLQVFPLGSRFPHSFNFSTDPVCVVRELHTDSRNAGEKSRIVDSGGCAIERKKGNEGREKRS